MSGVTNEQAKYIAQRKRAYQDFMSSPQAELIMEDLAHFCSANRTTFEPDDPHGRKSAFREGRREVYLRILTMSRPEPESP